MTWVACFLGVLALATGCVLEDKPVDPQFDAGVEAGMCVVCPPVRPICTDELECVQCTAEDDDYCSERALVCDIGSSTCVECLNDSNCTTADAARCDAKECGPCDDNAQCTGIDGLPSNPNACDNEVCVDCTPENEAMTCPDGDSCNPGTNECSGIQDGSRLTCELCVSDRDCGEEGNRCVAMDYEERRYPNEESGFCLTSVDLGGPCVNPYRIVITRTSMSGADADDYCGINEDLTTCEAVRALLADDPCELNNGNDDCPQPAGRCRKLPGMNERCTYRCRDPVECKLPPAPGSTCGVGSGGSGGGDPYCGG